MRILEAELRRAPRGEESRLAMSRGEAQLFRASHDLSFVGAQVREGLGLCEGFCLFVCGSGSVEATGPPLGLVAKCKQQVLVRLRDEFPHSSCVLLSVYARASFGSAELEEFTWDARVSDVPDYPCMEE